MSLNNQMFLVCLCVGHICIQHFPRVWQKTVQSRTISGIRRGFKSFLGSQLFASQGEATYCPIYFSSPLHMDFVVLGSRNGSGQPHLVTQTTWDPGNTWSCFTSSASRLGENDPGSQKSGLCSLWQILSLALQLSVSPSAFLCVCVSDSVPPPCLSSQTMLRTEVLWPAA